MSDSDDDDSSWVTELESALLEGCDFGILRNICKGRPVADHLRTEVWQICLNVAGKGDQLAFFDELYDMPEQEQLRLDCQALVDNLGNDEEDKVSVISDIESILTFYCKSRNEQYRESNGWLEIVQPLLALKQQKAEVYNLFYAIVTKYVPKECVKNGECFHLFRLLMLYHDPELCSFLDSKRITPDLYALKWTLFATPCDLKVIHAMWDVYFQQTDTFLIFFLALVILLNAKEQLLQMAHESKQAIVDTLQQFPSALEADDIEDFCSLAQYYASRTPQSFRRDYQHPLFGYSVLAGKDESIKHVSQALCLPVSVGEILSANQVGVGDRVQYFVVDCRPAEQYNSGHLPTAFHLDLNLMLQNPVEFSTAVQALFATKQQAVAAGSIAGGEHLCFMGSGREEEDLYVNMVVANFLQKNTMYVSIAREGYAALHFAIKDNLNHGLTDHNPRSCIACNPDAGAVSDAETLDEFGDGDKKQLASIIGKFSSVVKSKSAVVKEKLTNYIKNESSSAERHVQSSDKGRRYRNMASVFTIDDDEDEMGSIASSDDERRETVNLETWLKRPEVIDSFKCQEIKPNGYMVPSWLLVTKTHLYVLRELPNQRGMALIQARRSLTSVVKITSKKRHPELITFKYGTNDDDGLRISHFDRFLIPKAGEATKAVKIQIIKVLDSMDS